MYHLTRALTVVVEFPHTPLVVGWEEDTDALILPRILCHAMPVNVFMYLGHFKFPSPLASEGFHPVDLTYCDDETYVCLISSSQRAGICRLDRSGRLLSCRTRLPPARDGDMIMYADGKCATAMMQTTEYQVNWDGETTVLTDRTVIEAPPACAHMTDIQEDGWTGAVTTADGQMLMTYVLGDGVGVYHYFSQCPGYLVYHRRVKGRPGLDLYTVPIQGQESGILEHRVRLDDIPFNARLLPARCYFSARNIVVAYHLDASSNVIIHHYQGVWSPGTHRHFPAPVRKAVEVTYCLQRSGQLPVPRDLLPTLAAYLAT